VFFWIPAFAGMTAFAMINVAVYSFPYKKYPSTFKTIMMTNIYRPIIEQKKQKSLARLGRRGWGESGYEPIDLRDLGAIEKSHFPCSRWNSIIQG